MNAERLLAHFEQVADAPNVVAHVRRHVVNLAVRGKLVRQQSEWAALVLGELGTWGSGGTPTRTNPDYYGGTIPWLVIGDLNDGIVTKAATHITEAGLANSSAKIIEPGTVLVAMYGSIGKLGVAGIRCATNQAIAHCKPDSNVISTEYLFMLLKSLREDLLEMGQGVAQQNISQKILKAHRVTVPQLAEQHRIVAKVDELMSLCDEMENVRSRREATRGRFTKAALHRLDAPDPTHWDRDVRFALDALPVLTTRADQISALRQTVLNLAVRGKLLHCTDTAEPATDLLTRIRSAKEEQRRPSQYLPFPSDERPFTIPATWEWTYLGALCLKTGSGSTPRGGREVYKPSGIPFLRSQNVHNEGLRLSGVAFIDRETHQRMRSTAVRPDDVLLNITGASLGRSCRVPSDIGEANVSQHVAILRPALRELSPFLHLVVLSPYFQAIAFGKQTGAGRGGLPKNRMDRIPVPLPPLAEQERIVAKVAELTGLCDGLALRVVLALETRNRLLRSLLADALSQPTAATAQVNR